MNDFFKEKRPHHGLDYAAFMEREMEQKLKDIESGKINDAHAHHIKMNYHRSSRIQKTYTVSQELCESVKSIEQPQLWMVLTEAWCGDSAQILPEIAKVAACNKMIELKILLRDENPDIMERYLTDGKRAIPKLIAFDPEGNELFRWGPRPKAAAALVCRHLADGIEKMKVYEKLHKWYAKDRGKAIEAEFHELLGHFRAA
ncbi:thioredoxin family protein [candidate division KSB1 bacterium]|nr:thioredoxin family protein [candidate division KSB1 bacterium]